MASAPLPNSEALADDLLKEKSLWAIYRRALRIQRSWVNLSIAATFLVGTFLVGKDSKAPDLATQVYSVATVSLGSTVSLLGFLIAGFSFFATVSDKALFCRMAEQRHAESGLSYLKYNMFIFMKVFTEFLLLCIASLALTLILQPSSAIRESVSQSIADWDWPPCVTISWPFASTMLAILLGILVASFVYILLELGSFIYNVHHVVMTNVIWELMREEDKAETASNAKDQPPEAGST
jgi:hypothetical protein